MNDKLSMILTPGNNSDIKALETIDLILKKQINKIQKINQFATNIDNFYLKISSDEKSNILSNSAQ
jgi:hypothetical protein